MFALSYRTTLTCLILGVLIPTFIFAQNDKVTSSVQTMPIGGNTWQVSGKSSLEGEITEKGIQDWNDISVSYRSYFRITNPGTLKLWINAEAPNGASTLAVTILGKTKKVSINANQPTDVFAGEWNVRDTGYIAIELKGIRKVGEGFANIIDYKIGGSIVNEGSRFVKNNQENFFYWGRRGPSVHLGYQVPEELEVEYYYNEITVPEGEDVIGSYYMANGFSGGYFGIQVNSEAERRVLFSVWSPFVTDNPEDIPEEDQIKLLKRGEGVHAGEFGNEGSGGQSFLRYDWKAGNTYKFLLKGTPVEKDHTVYTAWFFAPEDNVWKLIASFSRPKTNAWLKGFHSFLENFSPNQGIYERKVLFNNQWIVDRKGNWKEVNQARFTADNTARMGFRMDYAGGIQDGKFYLRNCGFFSDYTTIGMIFNRPYTNQKPMIDLSKLP